MSASFGAVVVSSPRPHELAAFHRDLLGWTTVSDGSTWGGCALPETNGRA